MRRAVLYILCAIVLLGGALLCVFRWDDWFYNPAEQTYSPAAEPTNILISFGANSADRIISWRTNKPVASFLCLNGDTLPVEGHIVASRGGEAAYYKAYLPSLNEGLYTYFVQSGDYRSADYSFSVDTISRFWVIGDMAEAELPQGEKPDFIAYIGNVVSAPLENNWQRWFNHLDTLSTELPQVLALGETDCLNQIQPMPEERWLTQFGGPSNGPERFAGSSYFIDFPDMRLVVLNTVSLLRFSDYTITQSWLSKVLSEAGDKWKVVVMHHPVHSAAMDMENPLIFWFFHRTLKNADVVFAGHDHNFSRRTDEALSDLFVSGKHLTTPVYVVTSASSDSYLPKCNPLDQRIGCNRAFYEEVLVNADSLQVVTRLLDTDEVYDAIIISRADRNVMIYAYEMPEILEIPEKYKGQDSKSVRRAEMRINLRKEE